MLKSSVPESSQKYICDSCHYYTSRYSQYVRHLDTTKHKKYINSTDCQQISTNFNKESSCFVCKCGKKYKERTGLWRHSKNCNYSNYSNKIENNKEYDILSQSSDVKYLTSLVLEVVKNNSELQKQNHDLQAKMLDICAIGNGVGVTNNTINNNVNSHNKTFNLQVFLNETCKDAMNISEFIDTISLQLSDLETLGHLGYVEGISKIIIKNLRALDVEKRPVHCSDIKREIMYVKDKDKWEKENDEKQKIKQVISSIVSKNLGLLPEFQKKYPDCMNPESKKSDEYNQIIMEAMGGGPTEVGIKNKEKIVRRIAKEVTIDK